MDRTKAWIRNQFCISSFDREIETRMAAVPELFAREDQSSEGTSLLYTSSDTKPRGGHHHQNISTSILVITYQHNKGLLGIIASHSLVNIQGVDHQPEAKLSLWYKSKHKREVLLINRNKKTC